MYVCCLLYVVVPAPNCNGVFRREVLEKKLGHEGGSLKHGISAFITGSPRAFQPFFYHVRTLKRTSIN